MAVMQHRRTWYANDGQRLRKIEVIYRALSGWMEIEVDGVRIARGWREWQTAFGGANLAGELEGHRIEARITQPFDKQEYSFALRIDGVLQPGSDPQPEPAESKRKSVRAMVVMSIFIAILVAGVQIAIRLN